jgi:hypothetical protein
MREPHPLVGCVPRRARKACARCGKLSRPSNGWADSDLPCWTLTARPCSGTGFVSEMLLQMMAKYNMVCWNCHIVPRASRSGLPGSVSLPHPKSHRNRARATSRSPENGPRPVQKFFLQSS